VSACVIPGRAEHPADEGLMVCWKHLERLAVMLREVEDQAVMLDARPSMMVRTDSGKGSLASERAPARLDVLVHRDHRRGTGKSETDDDAHAAGDTLPILDVLHSWARVVREERDLASPERVTVSGERDLLTRHLEWVCAQPWVDEAYSDIRTLAGQLKSSNGTNAIRPKAVGVCPTLLEDGECGGRLWPNDERGEVTCDNCGRIFGSDELRHLGEMLIRQGYVELFRAVWFTGVPAGTIRRWVSEGRCTSEKDGRRLLVQIAEVEQLRDRRKRVAS
jgi:hypothetical protein